MIELLDSVFSVESYVLPVAVTPVMVKVKVPGVRVRAEVKPMVPFLAVRPLALPVTTPLQRPVTVAADLTDPLTLRMVTTARAVVPRLLVAVVMAMLAT